MDELLRTVLVRWAPPTGWDPGDHELVRRAARVRIGRQPWLAARDRVLHGVLPLPSVLVDLVLVWIDPMTTAEQWRLYPRGIKRRAVD